MAPRELSHWQLLPAWKLDIIAHGYRLLWPAQTTASILEMSAEQISRVGLAAQLHDLGKLALPKPILLKPGPLSDGNWAIIRRHPEVGRIVVAHHECWDGGGYPSGLPGSSWYGSAGTRWNALLPGRKGRSLHATPLLSIGLQTGIDICLANRETLLVSGKRMASTREEETEHVVSGSSPESPIGSVEVGNTSDRIC
jgi:hypothetical protein